MNNKRCGDRYLEATLNQTLCHAIKRLLRETGMRKFATHVGKPKLINTNIRVHVIQFIEFTDFEEQHRIEILGLEDPPLTHGLWSKVANSSYQQKHKRNNILSGQPTGVNVLRYLSGTYNVFGSYSGWFG